MLVVSADGINSSPRRWVYGVDVLDQDPQDILAVRLPTGSWVDGTSLSRLWRDWFAERLGTVDAQTIERVEAMLRTALDL